MFLFLGINIQFVFRAEKNKNVERDIDFCYEKHSSNNGSLVIMFTECSLVVLQLKND